MTNFSNAADRDALLLALDVRGGRAAYRHARVAAGFGADVRRSDDAVLDLLASGRIENWTAANGQMGVKLTPAGVRYMGIARARIERQVAEARKAAKRAARYQAKRAADLARFGVRKVAA